MDHRRAQSYDLDDEFTSSHSTLLSDIERQQERRHATPPPPPPSKTPIRSTAYLDGLRGLAALFVFIQHITSFDLNVHEQGFGLKGNYYFASLPFVRIVFCGGDAAVTIFFVLSGYVLSKSPLQKGMLQNGNHRATLTRLASAVIRRPIRLYLPPMGVTFAVAVLMHTPFGSILNMPFIQPSASLLSEVSGWFGAFVKFFNPFQTHASNKAWFVYDIVVWTLPIELKGSMLVYVLAAVYTLCGSPLALSLLLLVISVFVLLHFAQWTMACFIAGLILSYFDVYSLDTTFLARRFKAQTLSIFWNVCFVIGFWLICQPAADAIDTPGWHNMTLLVPEIYGGQYFRFWHSWGAILVVYSALRLKWLQNILHSRALRYLGKVSFVLYLSHLPVFALVGDRFSRALGEIYLGAEPTWWDNRLYIPNIGPAGISSRFLFNMAVMLPISLVVADFGTKVLDQPSVSIGNWLVRRIGLDKNVPVRKEPEMTQSSVLPMHSVHVPAGLLSN